MRNRLVSDPTAIAVLSRVAAKDIGIPAEQIVHGHWPAGR